MIRVRLGDEKEARVHEVVAFRESLIERFERSALSVNPGRIHLNLDMKTIPAWADKLFLQGTFMFHRQPPAEREVQAVHFYQGFLKNPDGTPQMETRKVWPDAPHAFLLFDARHDGKKWDLKIQLTDLQSGTMAAGREPVMRVRQEVENLGEAVGTIDPFVALLAERGV